MSQSKTKKSEGSRRVKVAIAGVGNCASSFVQGIEFYRNSNTNGGVITPIVGGLRPQDIQICSAFDVDRRKVGKRLSEAIHALPNNSMKIWEGALEDDPLVLQGPVLDGVADHMRDGEGESSFQISDLEPVDVVKNLHESGAEIVLCYLPVGSEEAVRFYARAALEANCGFVNCVPVFIANDPEFERLFREAGLPLVGDDIRSQVGATIVHQRLSELFVERGYAVESTYQLNVGGNTDFRNMLDRTRLQTKKRSKTNAVRAKLGDQIGGENIHVGPSDFVPHLNDQKIAFIEIKGSGFANAPISLELKLSVCDSPNSAGVVMDVVRHTALARGRNHGGVIDPLCSYFMKSPPRREEDVESLNVLSEWATSHE